MASRTPVRHDAHLAEMTPGSSRLLHTTADLRTGDRSAASPASTSDAGRRTVETMFDHVRSRQIGSRQRGTGLGPFGVPPYTSILSHLTCGPENGPGKGTILCDAQGHVTSPVFTMKFSSGRVRYRNMIAMGDEEGYVSIIRVTDTVPSSLGDPSDPFRPIGQWRAHKNAVFDLEWANDDRWMYCASGDTKLSLWDTGYASRISTFHSGRASVKALSVKSDNHHVVASAGRDGDLYIHDVRVKEATNSGMPISDGDARSAHRPVLKLDGPHSILAGTPGKAPKFGYARSSVTSLCFLKETNSSVLATGGQDGRIKLWDLRYTTDPVVTHQPLADHTEALSEALCEANEGRSIHHIASMRQPPLSQRVRGVTSLSLHPDGTRLLASYIGGQHLLFDVSHPEHGPSQWFGGNMIDSFYVKSAFSPDGTHIISGSSDCNAYIWSLQDKEGTNPIVLTGHARELTTVAWNPADHFQLMTAGDDHVAKFWRLDTSKMQPKEVQQAHDPQILLQERAQNDARMRARTVQPQERAGKVYERIIAADDNIVPTTVGASATPMLQPCHDVRTPLRVRNILLEGSERGPAKRKPAKQLTISDALRNRRKRQE